MKTKLKITGGEWVAQAGRVWGNNGVTIATIPLPNNELLDDKAMSEQVANSELIAQAGTVANKCGLMPEELLKQRDELAEMLKQQIQDCERLASMLRQHADISIAGGSLDHSLKLAKELSRRVNPDFDLSTPAKVRDSQ